ncbi:putative 24-dehydrocholesterol reductase precursor [Rhizodiscina lignyota]|uniref:Delta(24)-sterol reductase n=1 Tax=Rhizodiscina lignyota TaxID=1504668 RepID=A0A9P4IFY4_9PEZI|nr:putative 24-dehydrocholesterol reductase precursor [Rhizodiscina lignyota]
MDRHEEKVAVISERVKSFHSRGEKFRIYHGSTNTTRSTIRRKDNVVDTSSLDSVIKVDTESKTALAEPNVSMEKLLEACLSSGLMPLVVPEFRTITVGGAFAGTAGESSSFKHGIFDSTINSIEVVLADGGVIHASKTQNSDLLYGSAGACGTLGVVTLLEVELMDAKPYVELEHKSISSPDEAMTLLEHAFEDSSIDFVEGILFSPSSGVILTGRLISAPSPSTPIHRFTRPQDQHFYRHCEKLLHSSTARKSSQPITDVIPIRDYIFRYDRGCFWAAKYAFRYFGVPFNRITRFFLDPLMKASIMFQALHESGLAAQGIIQDVSFPVANAAQFVSYVGSRLDCYPLWLCPLRATAAEKIAGKSVGRSFGMGRDAPMDGKYVNVGVWCMAPSKSPEEFVRLNREIEGKVHELRGLKALYAHTYYTQDEFWSVYDKEGYDALRVKYQATGLPSVYDKVKVVVAEDKAEWKSDATFPMNLISMFKALFWNAGPFSGLYGVWRTIVSREYLLKDKIV